MPNQLWLNVPEVGRYLVTDGLEILVDPSKSVDCDSLKLFLLGSCMGALLHQRGNLVIHGNAIASGDECVVVAGASGNGKSTLAAAFHQKGYSILADDLTVIDESCAVWPGYPQMKIWSDSAEKLNIDTTILPRVRPQVKKYALSINSQFTTKPAKLKHIYILQKHHSENFVVEPIKGLSKFGLLDRNTYRKNYVNGMGLKAHHMSRCSRLANFTSVTRIIRPIGTFLLDELVEIIESDIKSMEGVSETVLV